MEETCIITEIKTADASYEPKDGKCTTGYYVSIKLRPSKKNPYAY